MTERNRLPRRALRVRFTRHGLRGMTLVEIMIVVVIMGLIVGAVSIGVFPALARAKVKTAGQEVLQIEHAVQLYQQDHANSCPTMAQSHRTGVDRP